MKTAVFLPNWVGDACMATPSLRALHAMPSLGEIHLVGKPGPLGVLEGLPYGTHTIAFKPRSKSASLLNRRGLIRELRRQRFDMAVLFPNSLSSAMIAYLGGIKRRIGFHRDARRWLLTDAIPLRESGVDWRQSSAIDYYLRIVRHLGADVSDRSMSLAVTNEDDRMADQLLSQLGLSTSEPLVVINNASAAAPSRLWPAEHTATVARELAIRGNQVLFHAGPSDRQSAQSIVAAANHPKVKSMGEAADLPLGLSRALLARANVVLSTDSGPRHMAVALNRSVVSLFGPTSTQLTRTYNIPETVLSLELACSPCFKSECPLKHHQCLQGITPERVLHAVLARLRDPNTKAA